MAGLIRKLGVTFHHIKPSAKVKTDHLSRERNQQPNFAFLLLINFSIGLQTEQFRVGTILNPNSDTILNNSSSSRSIFHSESVLLVPNPIPIGKSGSDFKPLPPKRLESNSKIGSDFSFFLKQTYHSTYNSTNTLKCQKEF